MISPLTRCTMVGYILSVGLKRGLLAAVESGHVQIKQTDNIISFMSNFKEFRTKVVSRAHVKTAQRLRDSDSESQSSLTQAIS